MTLVAEARAFRNAREEDRRASARLAALFLTAGIEMRDAIAAAGAQRAQILMRIERLLERERLRGLRRHWSYDLNRHIALKQALESLRPATPGIESCSAAERAERRTKRKRRRQTPLQTTGADLPRL